MHGKVKLSLAGCALAVGGNGVDADDVQANLGRLNCGWKEDLGKINEGGATEMLTEMTNNAVTLKQCVDAVDMKLLNTKEHEAFTNARSKLQQTHGALVRECKLKVVPKLQEHLGDRADHHKKPQHKYEYPAVADVFEEASANAEAICGEDPEAPEDPESDHDNEPVDFTKGVQEANEGQEKLLEDGAFMKGDGEVDEEKLKDFLGENYTNDIPGREKMIEDIVPFGNMKVVKKLVGYVVLVNGNVTNAEWLKILDAEWLSVHLMVLYLMAF